MSDQLLIPRIIRDMSPEKETRLEWFGNCFINFVFYGMMAALIRLKYRKCGQ